MPTEYLAWKKVWGLTPLVQGAIIAALYVCTVFLAYVEYKAKGTMFGYPLSISILFVPIYEEVLFRGFVLGYFKRHNSTLRAIIFTSIIFALWHLKNIFFLSPGHLLYQIAYAGLIVSPILSFITVKAKTIWPAVIIHYINNLASPLSWVVLGSILAYVR